VRKNYRVYQAQDDADVLIVQTAIEIAQENHRVVVVSTDVDLLTLLIANTPVSCNEQLFFMKPSIKKCELIIMQFQLFRMISPICNK